MERVTNQARLPWNPCEPRYLSVGRYATAWYPPYHVLDAAV